MLDEEDEYLVLGAFRVGLNQSEVCFYSKSMTSCRIVSLNHFNCRPFQLQNMKN